LVIEYPLSANRWSIPHSLFPSTLFAVLDRILIINEKVKVKYYSY
jgi:hypothetical protein